MPAGRHPSRTCGSEPPRAGSRGHPGTDDLYHAALDRLRAGGAGISVAAVEPASEETSADELVVLLAELKDDLDAYLERRDGDGPRSLSDVVEFNRRHATNELAHFGQDLFEDALASGGRAAPAYAEARARCLRWAVEECLSPALEDDGAPEFLVAPAYAPAWKSDLRNGDRPSAGGLASSAPSIAGWPVLCLPLGLTGGLPVGMVLIGRPHSEARLLAVGHAVEARLDLRSDATFAPSWGSATRG